MKKYFKIAVIFVLTLGCLGNSDYASANEQVSNAQIYKKLLEIDKGVNEMETRMTRIEKRMTRIETRMTGIEQKLTVLENTLKLEVKRLDQGVGTLNTTFWSVFGFIGGLLAAIIGFNIYLSGKMGRYQGIKEIGEERKRKKTG
ncbi:MAG: hypothetical protein FVQ77_01845 [Cytophagales bacterium]|nr:hypothetical protein [Cytophagales bacterium]